MDVKEKNMILGIDLYSADVFIWKRETAPKALRDKTEDIPNKWILFCRKEYWEDNNKDLLFLKDMKNKEIELGDFIIATFNDGETK